MSEKDNDYLVLFRGAKISKKEANKTGIALICGFLGILISILIFKEQNNALATLIPIGFAVVGYFIIANRIIK